MTLDLSALEHRVHTHPQGTDITLPRDEVMAALQRLRETEMFLRSLVMSAHYSCVVTLDSERPGCEPGEQGASP